MVNHLDLNIEQQHIPPEEGHEVSWKSPTTVATSTFDTDDDSYSSKGIPTTTTTKDSQPPRCKRYFKTCVVSIVLLIVLVVGLSVALLGSPNPADFFVQQAPPGREQTHEWRRFGNDGLDLVIENALEDSWTPYLTEYVEKWDAGFNGLDPMSLSVVRVDVDTECEPRPGRLKVCNGNYGHTDWRGLNIILLQHGFIAHSVAKLNDFWLQKEGELQMKYTMCHELGHGFGLAHTDEQHWNINTGECMDYTTRPRNNLDPGKFNFGLLASIYGNSTSTDNIINNNGANTKNNGKQRPPRLRRQLAKVVESDVPDEVTGKYNQVVRHLESRKCRDCLVDLGDGFQVEIHQLSVN